MSRVRRQQRVGCSCRSAAADWFALPPPVPVPFARLSGALTQVKKKGRAVKDALVSKIREACQTYSNVFVFDVENMKNSVMKDVREEWKGSKSVRPEAEHERNDWGWAATATALQHLAVEQQWR